ncbi:MAG: HD domain-containing protein, partial [Desulfobacterales bacterium]|nr:HD domain-containing protein [Desulfobacterales bacterium]
ILNHARKVGGADAGTIFLREENKLKFSYTQNSTLEKRLPPGEKLIYTSFEIPVDENSLAGYVALTGKSLNIPNTEKMDPTLPFRFNRKFDEAAGYWTHSLLTIPLQTTTGEVIGVLQLINCRNQEDECLYFSEETEKIMSVFAGMAAIALERARMTRLMILRTIRMAEMRDPKETGPHVNRVAGFALVLYEAWAHREGLGKKEADEQRDHLRIAAMLHDVGKVSIPDAVLKKPGKLNAQEYAVMQQHTISGARLFIDKASDFDKAAMDVALNHHERWDGQGYPGHVDLVTGLPLKGLTGPDGRPLTKSGADIPLFGRIAAIADVFDALSSRRCYKEPWGEDEVLTEMEKCKGAQFDPQLLDLFFAKLPAIRGIQKRYREEDADS